MRQNTQRKKGNDRSERLEGKEDKEESLRNSRKKDKSRYFKKWTFLKKGQYRRFNIWKVIPPNGGRVIILELTKDSSPKQKIHEEPSSALYKIPQGTKVPAPALSSREVLRLLPCIPNQI